MKKTRIRRLWQFGLMAPFCWSFLQLTPPASTPAFAQDEEATPPLPPRVRPMPGVPMGRPGADSPPGMPGTEAGAPGPKGPTRDAAAGASPSGTDAPVRPSEDRQKPPVVNKNAKVTIDFVDADISDIIKYMAEITGRNFILGDKLSGKITIISHEKVTVSEAYEAFLSALEVVGYTTVTVGSTTKVVKSNDAAKTPLRIFKGSDIPYTDNFVTQIFQLENVAVKDISAVVKEMASSAAHVVAYSPTNTLILTDSASNIRRVYQIVKELDVAAPQSRLEIVHLNYATASDVESILEELYAVESTSSTDSSTPEAARARRRARRDEPASGGAAADDGGSATATNVGDATYISKIISDERTNSIIVKANEEAMKAIVDLIKRIDVDVDPASRSQIHVVYLQHAKAEDMASVLSSLSSGTSGGSSSTRRTGSTSTGSRSSSSSTSRGRSGSSSSSRGASTGGGGRSMMGQSGDEDYDMLGAAGDDGPGPMVGGPPGPGSMRPSTSAVAAFSNGMSVASDPNTNSLVIMASPEDFRIIKQVVDKLDIRRKQVFVEAVVMEMASDDTSDMGVGYHMGSLSDSGTLNLFSSQMNGSSLGLSTDALSGLAMGVFGQNIDVSVTGTDGSATTLSVPAFGIALNALQSNSHVNILSTPNILTLDNEEAKIVVGRNIPFPVSTGRDANNNPIVSYQREDVAITLKVTPQINESNYVSLEVYQEVSEIEEDSQGLDVSSAGFITSKRTAETTVEVKDNQTIVLGGLIGNTETHVETKIPVLGDIPLIGVLFRGTRSKSRKTNLLIFLTPHIISGPEDLEEIYRVKVAQRAEFTRRFYGRSMEEREAEMADLLQYSLNIVDRPSVYRTKTEAENNVETISAPNATSTTPATTTPATATPVTPATPPTPDTTPPAPFNLDDEVLPEAPDAPPATPPSTGTGGQ